MGFEFEILYMIQKMHHPILDSIMIAVTKFGNGGRGWIAVAILLLLFKRTRKSGLCMLLSMGFCALIGEVWLKNMIERLRPCQVDAGVRMLISTPGGYSFPSGHTTNSFAAATSIFLNHKKAGIAALVLATMIGFSRLYLFVHFPTDVLCGLILGVTVAIFIKDMLYNRKKLC
ncbi:MAG: phosphatase PAP2 family protein [Lachnospiraceae bacterium]|nr:phosphatase PAP2 family protein [Lachnospiraceae bacterium]